MVTGISGTSAQRGRRNSDLRDSAGSFEAGKYIRGDSFQLLAFQNPVPHRSIGNDYQEGCRARRR